MYQNLCNPDVRWRTTYVSSSQKKSLEESRLPVQVRSSSSSTEARAHTNAARSPSSASSTRSSNSGTHDFISILDSPNVKIEGQWHCKTKQNKKEVKREINYCVHCLGHLPLTVRFRSWLLLHGLT